MSWRVIPWLRNSHSADRRGGSDTAPGFEPRSDAGPSNLRPRLALATIVIGALLIGILCTVVIPFRAELRDDVRAKIIERDAAVLYPVAEGRLRDAEADPRNHAFVSEMLLPSVLKTVEGMMAVVIYDVEGNTLQVQPTNWQLTTLDSDDYGRLLVGSLISHYHPDFHLARYLGTNGGPPVASQAPVLEVLLPLHAGGSGELVGFVQYFIDARPLKEELDAIDSRVNRQTVETLAIGSGLIILVLIVAYWRLSRAQRTIAERNERLTRANFELTLAAKTSALGVITSHLIHGLQGPVAGLRAVVADRAGDGGSAPPEWQSAATYAERMQTMIHETVALLGDTSNQTSYELSGIELATTIRDRNTAAAAAKGVVLEVDAGFAQTLDSHRGSLICLIATNLVQNAIEATDPGRHVAVQLEHAAEEIILLVRDEGNGVPEKIRNRLFEPGRTGRAGGTGLGLAISQLLARQIGGTLELAATGPHGTTFRLSVPAA